MVIKKISDKYNLFEDGASYIVDFGDVKKAEEKTATIEITGIEEASLVTLKATCGCTTTDKTVIDKETVRFKLNYNNCDLNFNKVIVVNYNKKKVTTIILKGRCKQ
jgi:Protein of unknown function (DUF1573)